MANRIHDLTETKGTFQVKGITGGTEKDKFYTEKKTRTGKDFRMVNFMCGYDAHKNLYLSMNGMPQMNVYFSKRNKETGKTETKPVPWAMRETFNEDGFRMIGVNLGLTKTTDANGKTVNDRKTMHSFDACDYICANMKDDMSVFIRGNIEYSSFMDNNGDLRRSQKLIPSQISLCQEVDFNEYGETNRPVHDFTQNIIFMGIEKENVDGNDTGRFVILAKIVTYNDVVDTEFITTNTKLATTMRKNLKPYNSITVHGNIEVTHQVEEVEQNDGWGEVNPMTTVSASTKTEFVVTGAEPTSIDRDTYTEANVSEAISKVRNSQRAENNFGNTTTTTSSNSPWGDDSFDDSDPWS